MMSSLGVVAVRRIVLSSLLVGLLGAPAFAQTPSKQAVAPSGQKHSTQVASAKKPAKAPPKTTAKAPAASPKRPLAAAAPASKQAVATGSARAPAPSRPPVRPVVAAAAAGGAAVAAASASHGERLGLREAADPLQLDSSVALVMDAETSEVLLSKNDTAVLPIASLTKLMTGILIADAGLSMDQTLTITQADIDRLKGSGSRLPVGSRITRGEALHLALMSSENRAAHALARTYPGGVPHFVRLMNQKAQALGMTDTRFVDPTGLSSQNKSSARDLALLTAASHERPVLRELSTSPSYELALGQRVLPYRNSNRLIHNEEWQIGLQKTGFIREAGRCVVMQVQVAGRQLIMVLLDASNNNARVGDAERLRRWVESTLGQSAQSAGLGS
jgi:serine-type D-Ala-D-Ala endopeptidase (penicillin-binding protein 7)